MSKLQDLINSLVGSAPNFGRGIMRGATADVLGAPVDTLNAARQGLLMPAQAGNPVARGIGGLLGPVQQTGTSDYFAEQMGLPEGQGMAYEAGRMLSPSPQDLMTMARRAPSIQELITYHGTRHQFPATEVNPLGEFDASKIGTGQGAQSYGHGIYFAENPNVAQSYIASGGSATAVPQSYAADVVGMMGGEQKAIEHLKLIMPPKGEKTFSGESREFIEQALRDVESGAYKAKQGPLYTADLPDEMIDRMLDWDKPFLDQSQKIKDLAKNLLPSAVYNQLLTQRSGDFVEELAKYKGGNAKASELMRQAGIPGIRYLDQGSRDKDKGTRNFVVFPGEEKKVKILKRD